MESINKLPIPNSLYDFVLFYECAKKDWKNSDSSVKYSIKGDGSLMNYIKWDVDYSNDPDDKGGNTKFGVTESTWKNFVKKYPNKGYSDDLNTMNKQGWEDVIAYYWYDISCAGYAKNYACAYAMFDMRWLGFSGTKEVLKALKRNADITNYKFTSKGDNYYKIADATHAYVDPMMAYDIIRKTRYTYLYNISTPNNTNEKYRIGWLKRSLLSFSPYGLFVITDATGLSYDSSLADWEKVMINWSNEWSKENKKTGYIRIHDWVASQQYIASVLDIQKDTNPETGINGNTYLAANSTSPSSQSTTTSGGTTYSGAGGVSQLGSYSNSQTTNTQNSNSQILEAIETLKKIHKRGEGVYVKLISDADIKKNTDTKKCSKFYTPDKTPQEFA